MAEKVKYRLYAMETSTENINAVSGFRFSRIIPDYILVYSSDTAPEGAAEIEGQNLARLTDSDRRWLLDCNAILLAEDAVKNQEAYSENLNRLIDELEKNLAAETAGKEESNG